MQKSGVTKSVMRILQGGVLWMAVKMFDICQLSEVTDEQAIEGRVCMCLESKGKGGITLRSSRVQVWSTPRPGG